jgi:hypothetical protein
MIAHRRPKPKQKSVGSRSGVCVSEEMKREGLKVIGSLYGSGSCRRPLQDVRLAACFQHKWLWMRIAPNVGYDDRAFGKEVVLVGIVLRKSMGNT